MPSIQMSFYRAKYKILIFFQIKDFLISRVFSVWMWMCFFYIYGRSNIKTWAQLQIISMNVSMPAWQMRAFSYIYLHLGKKAFKLIASSPVGQIDLRKSSLYQMVLFTTSWKLQSSQIIHHLCGNHMNSLLGWAASFQGWWFLRISYSRTTQFRFRLDCSI